jgi:hypothetical protein
MNAKAFLNRIMLGKIAYNWLGHDQGDTYKNTVYNSLSPGHDSKLLRYVVNSTARESIHLRYTVNVFHLHMAVNLCLFREWKHPLRGTGVAQHHLGR